MQINWVLVYAIIATVLTPILALYNDYKNFYNGVDLAMLVILTVFGVIMFPLIIVIMIANWACDIKVYWPNGKNK